MLKLKPNCLTWNQPNGFNASERFQSFLEKLDLNLTASSNCDGIDILEVADSR